MNIIDMIRRADRSEDMRAPPDPLAMLEGELRSALSIYLRTAARLLEGSGTRLLGPSPEFFSLEKNFFSALFLYSYHRAGLPGNRRVMYAAVNQCLRGMVTGCDNLLDGEYKMTLETDLPVEGTRFRSVLDIMVSDRVLFELLFTACQDKALPPGKVLEASAVSLKALTRSGAQEASEEAGVRGILPPDEVLRSVHHSKTGLLFQCPWALPRIIEDVEEASMNSLIEALYRIGMGCQIMDDMVDMANDLLRRRHNFVVSVVYHDSGEREALQPWLGSNPPVEEKGDLLSEFPLAQSLAVKEAHRFLEAGLTALFEQRHRFLVDPAITFLAGRIGAERFMSSVP